MVRLFASRGPGSFSTNPYDCPQPHCYIVAGKINRPFVERKPDGARVRSSSVEAKSAFYATIKSCNYLPNVLMKRESEDLGVDFVVGFDEHGCLTEGPTENAGIVTADKRLLFPKPEHVLYGTTMVRVMELARGLVKTGELAAVEFSDIRPRDIAAASEMLITGTTDNVVPVIEFDSRPVGNGRPGPTCARLNELLTRDMHENTALLTPVFAQ